MDERSSSSLSLPVFEAPVTDRVWLVGAHGGAGCTTIYRSAPDVYADAGRALPISGDAHRPSRIVLCARGDSRGHEALRELLNEADAGLFSPSILLGVAVTVPCSRPPLVLERSRRLVCSTARFAVRLPWIGSLMVDGECAKYPRAYESLRREAVKAVDMPLTTAS
jgi:hypothetical protein